MIFNLTNGIEGDLLELLLSRQGDEPIEISDLLIKACFTPGGTVVVHSLYLRAIFP